jgi:hypothetical protein
MNLQVALTSIVTFAVLEEFKFLKFSFELFHGTDYQWFVRCDHASLEALLKYPNVICNVFGDRIDERPDNKSKEFWHIMGEKMNVMADAWKGGNWTGVMFLDSDIVMTAPLMATISGITEDLILTPNHYPEATKHLAPVCGYYNGGFVFARNRRFHEWWRDAYTSKPSPWADQPCLNNADEKFSVATLSHRANIGFWRSASIPKYDPIPVDCEFLHVHLFQPLRTERQWIDKTFALHCLKFLRQALVPEHLQLFNEILSRDESRWYEATLRLS